MNEETTITLKDQTGFIISQSDITTGKVVVNDIEITSVEDWEKVIKSLDNLQQENQLLKIQVSSREEVANKYKEIIEKVENRIKLLGKFDGEKCTRGFTMYKADFNNLLQILGKAKGE